MSNTIPILNDPETLPGDGTQEAAPKSRRGWLRIVHDICLAAMIVYAVIQVCANIAHRPELVYPAEVQRQLDAEVSVLRAGAHPISNEYLDTVAKAYGFKDCEVGVKYGALCQDGEVEYDRSSDVCSTRGGVKEYIECK